MATTTNGTITFSYTTEALFNDVELISAFMTKELADESGSATDKFIITSDEKELVDLCVKQVVPKIFEYMLNISKCATGYSYENGNISFSVKNNNAYNENVLPLVDSTIYDCLKYGVLSEFYSICTQASLYGIVKAKYEEMLHLLDQRLYQLKKRSISSLY